MTWETRLIFFKRLACSCNCVLVTSSPNSLSRDVHCHLTSSSPGITVTWRHCHLTSLSPDVPVSWRLWSMSRDILVTWPHCHLISLSPDLTVTWRHCAKHCLSLRSMVTLRLRLNTTLSFSLASVISRTSMPQLTSARFCYNNFMWVRST